jgi:hypothetical protein
MTTMRVLCDLPWEQDAAGFRARIDRFLAIADRHHIKPLFVLFDSCWDPQPKLGRLFVTPTVAVTWPSRASTASPPSSSVVPPVINQRTERNTVERSN